MLSLNHVELGYQRKYSTTAAAYLPTLVLLLTSTGIFLLTGILSLLVAYDRSVAIARLIAISTGIAGALLLALLARNNQHSWLAWGSFAAIAPMLGFSLAFWQKFGVASSVVAAGIALLLPFASSAIAWTWSGQRRRLTAVTVAATALALFTLVMTADRSAMIGLLVGAVSTMLLYWRFGPAYGSWRGRLMDIVVVVVIVLGLITGWLFLAYPRSDEWLSGVAFGDTLLNRFRLWRTVIPLIQDYQFTGSGLGSTAMVYSTYIFLVHVPFHSHVHNLFLQIAVEQGVPGLIGFLGMISAILYGLLQSYRQAPARLQPFYLATWMSTVVLIGNGMFDSEIYGSRGAPFIFVPFAFALLLLVAPAQAELHAGNATGAGGKQRRRRGHRADTNRWRRAHPWLAACTPLLLIAIFWVRPGVQAAQQANWGAVAQSRAELSLYQRSKWRLQDAVRRDGADLTDALRYYYAALALNPNNVTAHRRLGQIMLSRGDMAAAQRHLTIAYAAAPNQLVTRQLLGEVYGVTGRIEEAAALWRTVAHANGQFETRYWWYNHLGAQTEAERIKQVIAKVSQ